MQIRFTNSGGVHTGFGEGERVPGGSSLLSAAELGEGGRPREEG